MNHYPHGPLRGPSTPCYGTLVELPPFPASLFVLTEPVLRARLDALHLDASDPMLEALRAQVGRLRRASSLAEGAQIEEARAHIHLAMLTLAGGLAAIEGRLLTAEEESAFVGWAQQVVSAALDVSIPGRCP